MRWRVHAQPAQLQSTPTPVACERALSLPLPLSRQTWAGGAHWPDFGFSPEADLYWYQLLRDWREQAPWGGLWLAMNEGACACVGGLRCSAALVAAGRAALGAAHRATWPGRETGG